MEIKIYFFMIIFTLTNLFFVPTPIAAQNTCTTNITAVFAFGDSTLDPGNNNFLTTIVQANHPPYGRDFQDQVSTGRFSNGKISTDYIVDNLGIKKLLPGYLDPTLVDKDLISGVSFASAGSGLDDLTATEVNVLRLGTQLGYFERALKKMERIVGLNETGRIVDNALFMVGAGTNDMLFNFYGVPVRTTLTLSGYQDLLLRNLEFVIRRLHRMGARRIAVTGLPPIGCLPVQVTIESLKPGDHMFDRVCVDQQNIDSRAYNTKLKALIKKLHTSLKGSKIAYIDIYNAMMDMITKPSAYGFEKTLDGCCGFSSVEVAPLCNGMSETCKDASKYMFWDAAHPTEAGFHNLANYFLKEVLPSLL